MRFRVDAGESVGGTNSSGQLGTGDTAAYEMPVSVSGLTGATQLAAYRLSTCALVEGGRLRCWGAWPGIPSGFDTDQLVPVAAKYAVH